MRRQGIAKRQGKPIVLIVEDDAGVRAALHLILDDQYDVLDASDWRAAHAAFRARPVDAILLDILLPEIDGLELLQELRQLDEAMPIIIVTAVKTVTTAVRAMKLGAIDYLTKPFDEDELHRVLRRAVKLRKASSWRRPDSVQRPGAPRSRSVQRAVDYLTTHYTGRVTVTTVAGAVGLSASHLAHLFRAETGMTVRAYLSQVRVAAAVRRLGRSDEKVATVARQVGFCDASHLARTLLRLTGRRPSSYRRSRP